MALYASPRDRVKFFVSKVLPQTEARRAATQCRARGLVPGTKKIIPATWTGRTTYNFGNLSGEYKTEVSYYNNWSIVVQGQGEAVCDGPTISAPDKLFIRAGTCWQNYVASTFGRAPIDRILRAFTYIFTKLCPMAVLSPQ